MGRTREDCAQLGLEAWSRGRFSSNANGTTVLVSHVSGITGARHVIEGNIEYGYSWLTCGWASNSGLNLTVACWAIALVDYQIEPEDPTRTIPNPKRRALAQ